MELHPGFTDPFTIHLGYESLRTSPLEASSWIECRPDLRDEHGRLHAAVYGYLIDSTAGVVCGMAATPSWVVTADLQLRILDPAPVGPIRADAVAVRPGRRQSLGEVRVVDEGADERVVAVGTVNHLVIPMESDLDVPADMPIGLRYGPAVARTAQPAPLVEHVGLRAADGVAEIPVAGDAVNPLGILHGGLSALLAGAAAVSCAADPRAVRVADMVLRFVGALPAGCTARAAATPARAGTTDVVRIAIADPADERGRTGVVGSVGLTAR